MKQLTYKQIIQELSNKGITRWNMPSLITKLSSVIDDLGMQRMHALENNQSVSRMIQIKSQQAHLIKIRDLLYNTYAEYNSRDRKHIRSDQAAQEGISNYHQPDAEDYGSWTF